MAEFVNIGYGNLVSSKRIISVLSPEASPVKRLVAQAKESGNLIDASCGKKTCSVIVTDAKLIILSALPNASLEALLNSENSSELSPEQ